MRSGWTAVVVMALCVLAGIGRQGVAGAGTEKDFLEWSLQDWKRFAKEGGFDRDAIVYENSFRGGDQREESGLQIEVVFIRGRLHRVVIGDTSEKGGEPEKRVMEAWEKVDKGAELRLKKIRDTQRAAGMSAGAIHWIGRTPYACGWSENNKGYVVRVGEQRQHKALVQYRNEVAELVISWGECIEKSRKKVAAATKRDPAAAASAFKEEMLILGTGFGHVEVIDREMLGPFQRIQSDYLEAYFWEEWPARSTGRLFAAAARCSDICERAEKQLVEGKLDFNPYREMWVVIGHDAAAAVGHVLGEYGRLADDGTADWPEDLEGRWKETMMRALAWQEEG